MAYSLTYGARVAEQALAALVHATFLVECGDDGGRQNRFRWFYAVGPNERGTLGYPRKRILIEGKPALMVYRVVCGSALCQEPGGWWSWVSKKRLAHD